MKKSWVVGKKEFLENLLSIRFLIIVLIFTLLVVGVTYGQILESQEERETTRMLFYHYIDDEDNGDYDDLVVYYSDKWGNPIEGKEIELYDMRNTSSNRITSGERSTEEPEMVRTTDEYGKVLFEDIKNLVYETDDDQKDHNYYNYALNFSLFVENQDKIDNIEGGTSINRDFKDEDRVNESFSEPFYFSFHFKDIKKAVHHAVEPDGSPSSDAELYVGEYLFSLDFRKYKEYLDDEGSIHPELKEEFEDEGYDIDDANLSRERYNEWVIYTDGEKKYFMETERRMKLKIYLTETKVAEADEYGYIDYEFTLPGNQSVKVQNKYSSYNYTFHHISEEWGSPLEVDRTLNKMTFPIIMVLPLIAIALSFDSVTKERNTNSLFFLLVKPIERWKIGAGKLVGSFAAISIPVIAVNSVSISTMWYMLGDVPSFWLILTFFLGSLAVLIFFLTLQMILSTLANSSVTALLGGLGFWLTLSLFYPAIEEGITSILGYEYGTYSYEVFTNYMILMNPNLIFRETTDLVYQGKFGLNLLPGITDMSLVIAMLIWIVGFIVLFLLVFHKRLVSD